MSSGDEKNLHFTNIRSENDASDVPHAQGKRKRKEINQKPKKIKYEPISQENSKETKQKKNELNKPPTIEELNNLKMTENLYNSSLFRLQIEELIKEVAIKNKRKKAFSSWLESFKQTINNVSCFHDILLSELKPTVNSKKPSKKDKFLNILATKYVCPYKTDQDIALKFEKPESFDCFGLYENNALAGPNLEASINIKMPKLCFNVKDFLNNRYFVKRFYYLIYITESLTVHKKSLRFHENNVLLPILCLQPTEDEKLIVNIYVTPSDDCFKPSRFLPNQNNLKQDLFDAEINDLEAFKVTPTVLYNSALAHDITLSENSAFIKATLEGQTNIQEGIQLLCVWLKQRQLDCGFGAFTSNLIMYLVAYLLVKKKLNTFMSSYQVVRNFWSFMITTNVGSHLISLGECSNTSFELFKENFSVVLMDKTGCHNLMAFLDENLFKKFIVECQIALKHLDNAKVESFHYLFLSKVPFALQYDVVLDVSEALPLKGHFTCNDQEKAKIVGYNQFLPITKLSELLQKGLNKRLLHIVPYIEVKYPEPGELPIKKVLYGLNLNPETAFNFLELGPALNDHAAANEFRNFWGHLSSDRRFRDGSTNVAVYFKTSTFRGRRGIIKRIIKYLLLEKLNLKLKLYYEELEEFLINKKIQTPYPIGTNEESSLKVIALADELGQKLRAVQMSLSITGIQGISDVFSYSQVFPPIAAKFKPAEHLTDVKAKKVIFGLKKPGMMPRYVEPLELVLHLEHSSKWPSNLEAIRHVKTSFYLEISKMLLDMHNIISNVTKDYLEVFYQGLVFRYRLYVPKEVGLMKKGATEIGLTKYTENTESEEYEKTLNILPKVNGALKGLQQQFPSFGPGTALIKRWLRSHLIDDSHLSDIVIDLLNASLYLNPTSLQESCTPQMSFVRFLKFISEFQWELQPLLVNFNEEISEDEVANLESKFLQHRDSLQPLYINMPYDHGQSLFTKHNPSKEILYRVQQLAKATLNLILRRIVDQEAFELKKLFRPNMEGYNLLIHLRPLMNPRRHEHLDNPGDSKIVLEKYEHHQSEKIPITGFNPIDLYLRYLRENYGHFATFFHDTYGGSTIGVLWNPKAKEAKEFKVVNTSGKKLEGDKLVLNEDAIIEDFYILGKGIVKWIEKK